MNNTALGAENKKEQMSFLLIWKCSMDKVMILRDIKTDRNDIYLIYCYLFWFLHSRGETP